MDSRTSALLRAGAAALAAAVFAGPVSAIASCAPQEYRSSVVGTDFDFIVDEDPSVFLCLEFAGRRAREMPDKTRDARLIQPAFVFVAYYEDGTQVDIAVADAFDTEDAAREEALRYAPRLGKLPTALREGVHRLVVHAGRVDATAFSDAGLIVVYAGNATRRIATHDLEETLFHESVHAAWDEAHAGSAAWIAAQESDGGFVTDYARSKPQGEDLAESALFAYGLLHHPERIPTAAAARIEAAIPARIAFVEALLPPGQPVFHRVGPRHACDGTGTTFTLDGVDLEELEPSPSDPGSSGEDGPVSECTIDLGRIGPLSDVLSNALMRGFDRDEDAVSSFLREARARVSDAEELRDAAAGEFGMSRPLLDRMIEEFRHCNCDHGPEAEPSADRSPAAAVEASPTLHEPRPETPIPSPERAASTAPDGDDLAGLRPWLMGLAVLLGLLLVVNLGTLIVLARRSGPRGWPGAS